MSDDTKTLSKVLEGIAVDFRLSDEGRIIGYHFPLGINKDYRALGTGCANAFLEAWNESHQRCTLLHIAALGAAKP